MKIRNMEFHENPSLGATLFYEDRRIEGWTEMLRLTQELILAGAW